MAELYPRPRGSIRRRSSRDGFNDRDLKPKRDGSLFAWTIFILLLVGLVAVCWMGTLYIFGHPEQPLGYAVLHKFKKLEAPKRFSEIGAPKGEFLDAKKLLARYGAMTPRQLRNESDKLLRNYIRNYQNVGELVPYVVGRFQILDSYQLTKNDFFQSGVVAVTQDSEVPQIVVEHAFTTEERMVPVLHRSLLTGLEIPVQRSINSIDLSPIIHIEKLPDGRLKFTTVPIQYPDYTATQGPGSLSLQPPPTLNVEAGLPIISAARMAEADTRYANYRRKVTTPANSNGPSANSLMPVRPAVTTSGQPAEPAVARALPADSSAPEPRPTATPAPTAEPPVARAIPVNGQTPPPASIENAPTVGTDVPLKPFMTGSASAPAVASSTSGKWQTYKPGQMPRGRLIDISQAPALATSAASERMYLKGNFVVTASGPTRAVMRAQGSESSIGPVIVEFPSDQRAPVDGTGVSRNSDRAFLITKVERKPDGTVNIWAREVTTP